MKETQQILLSRVFVILFFLLFIASFLDYSFTIYLLNHSPAFREGNPIVANAFEKNLHWVILSLKLLFPCLLLGLGLLALRDKRLSEHKIFLNFYTSSFIFITIFLIWIVFGLGWMIWHSR